MVLLDAAYEPESTDPVHGGSWCCSALLWQTPSLVLAKGLEPPARCSFRGVEKSRLAYGDCCLVAWLQETIEMTSVQMQKICKI